MVRFLKSFHVNVYCIQMREGDSIIINQLFLFFPETWLILWPSPWEIDESISLFLAFSSHIWTEKPPHYVWSSPVHHLSGPMLWWARGGTVWGLWQAVKWERGSSVFSGLCGPVSSPPSGKPSESLVRPLLPSAVTVASIKQHELHVVNLQISPVESLQTKSEHLTLHNKCTMKVHLFHLHPINTWYSKF